MLLPGIRRNPALSTLKEKQALTSIKFVADSNWTTDHTAPQETDAHGNTNNVLQLDELKKLEGAGAATMSTVTPTATTAALAGEVPKEKREEPKKDAGAATMSTVTPAATTAALAGEVPKENKEAPKETPGHDLPGAFPETPALETPMTEPAGFSIAPIPATAGAGNPIHLAPGEKVPDPSTITSNTVNSTVKTDKESYEKSDAPVTTGQKEAKPAETAGGAFGVPSVTGNMIPESSLPIGKDAQIPDTTDPGVTIQSAAPTSTTAALAGQVPKEPRAVPEVVQESQEKGDVAPEASANAEAVEEKKEVEQELKEKVPEIPTTSESVQKPIDQVTNGTTTAPGVPAIVSESIEKAKTSPEAAGSEEAVMEKSAVEKELEKKVPVENESGEPGPTETAATSETAPKPTSPEVKPTDAATEPLKSSQEKDLNAPADAPATTPATDAAKTEAKKEEPAPHASEDVSPSTEVPTTTTGTETKPTEAKSEPAKTTEAGPATPKKATESAAATPDSAKTDKSKRKKRFSALFTRIKDKLK